MSETPGHAGGNWKIPLLLVIFFGPLIGAYVLYYVFPQAVPQGHSNHGTLISPAKPLPEMTLETPAGKSVAARKVLADKWTFLYVGSSACGETCRKRLYDTRQVRTALNRKAPRVQRVFVATDTTSLDKLRAFAANKHPDLRILVTTGALPVFLNTSVRNAGNNGDVYVFDPLANWVLYYQPKDPAKGLLEDIKRLLKISSIG